MNCTCGSGYRSKDCCDIAPQKLRRAVQGHLSAWLASCSHIDATSEETIAVALDPIERDADEETYRNVLDEMMTAEWLVHQLWFMFAEGLKPPGSPPTHRTINGYLHALMKDDGWVEWPNLHEYDDGKLVKAMHGRYYQVPQPPFTILFRRSQWQGCHAAVVNLLVYGARLRRSVRIPAIFHREDIDSLGATWTLPHEVVHVVQRIGRFERHPAYMYRAWDGANHYRNQAWRIYQLVLDELDVIDVLMDAYGERYPVCDPYYAAVGNAEAEREMMAKAGMPLSADTVDAGLSRIDWRYYARRFGRDGREQVRAAFGF